MPKHDLPDGNEDFGNLIDLSAHLRRRTERSRPDSDPNNPKSSSWEIYRHAEYGDGTRPRFGRYDLLWLGMIVVVGVIVWMMLRG